MLGLALVFAPAALAQQIRTTTVDPVVRFGDGTRTLLSSQIGYTIPGVRVAYLMAPTRPDGDLVTSYDAVDDQDRVVLTGAPEYLGSWVGAHFWRLDLRDLWAPGFYRVRAGGLTSNRFPVVSPPRALWLDPHVHPMLVEQLRMRIRFDASGGFIDAGNDFRETHSHATLLTGILDFMEVWGGTIDPVDSVEILGYAQHIGDFLLAQQWPSGRIAGGYMLGMPSTAGEWPNHALGVHALTRLGRVSVGDPVRQQALFAAAAAGLAYTRANQAVGTARTELLVDRLRTEVAYHRATGDLRPLDEARALAREIRSRQLRVFEATPGGLYGLFRVLPASAEWTRLNLHAAGDHTGEYGALPLSALADLLELHPDDPEAPEWRATLEDYAYGFLLPATAASPLGLVPNGEYAGSVRWFSDLYHGMSMTYGLAAAELVRCGAALSDPRLVDLAERQLLWIGGLNTGEGFPAGGAGPFSCIPGQGYQWLRDGHGAYPDIPGSIVNGLSATPQFVPGIPPGIERPVELCDESFIAHTGGFLSAVTEVVRARLGVASTLLLARAGSGIVLHWAEVRGATGYHVYEDVSKRGVYPRLGGAVAAGSGGLWLQGTPEPLVFYRVTGTTGTTAGPK